MTTSTLPVYARDHTLLGICEALGEDFGFNPLLLRVPLAVCLLLNPWAVLGTYAGLGILVAFTRLISPNPRQTAEVEADPVAAERTEVQAEPDMAMAA
jgi:phage shock protein C